MIDRRSTIAILLAIPLTLAGWRVWSASGQIPVAPRPAATRGPGDASRFEFLVVESFDARYYMDTPGHLGRAASGRVAPRIALSDPVMRGTTKVGTVTHLDWNEARESLEVEFNPENGARICVGDAVYVPIPPDPAR